MSIKTAIQQIAAEYPTLLHPSRLTEFAQRVAFRVEDNEQKKKRRSAERQAEAQRIDPATAEVTWWYGLTLDPYEEAEDLPPEARQTQRLYFARRPDSEVWVEFGDLPEAVCRALEKRLSAEDQRRAGR